MSTLATDLVAQGFELRETHISQVFLAADVVYKCKKPVALGFLDFSTLELRKRFCDAELALNQRLAPSVYRGVVPITRDADGVHRIGGGGPVVEWAVQMRRLPERDAADRRLLDGRLGRAELGHLAERLARFHAGARCDEHTSHYGELAVIAGNVRENFAQTQANATQFLSPAELASFERWQHAFLRDRAPLFTARRAAGRIRDGHGDLRLEHCYLGDDGSIEIIDCIEFNERFRFGDVCSDVAFLAMDLEWHGRGDLGEAFLAAYARATQDYDLYGVVDFYESYRAHVRAKVWGLLAGEQAVPAELRARAAAQARKYYLLAEACARDPLAPPRLFAIGGLIATGKSTVAEQLAERTGAPIVDSDRTRKHLAGVAALTPLREAPFGGHYDPGTTARVYDELRRRAEIVLRSRRSVILDASFREREQRLAALELARRCEVPFQFIECVAPHELLRERLATRAQAPSISDGRLDLLAPFASRFEPVDELPAECHLRVDTSQSFAATLSQLA